MEVMQRIEGGYDPVSVSEGLQSLEYSKGYEDGYREGFEDGYDAAYDEGYDAGGADGSNSQ